MTETFIPDTDHLPDDTPCACANCDWRGTVTNVAPIENPSVRIEAGGIVPAGECPECGSLVYLEEKE